MAFPIGFIPLITNATISFKSSPGSRLHPRPVLRICDSLCCLFNLVPFTNPLPTRWRRTLSLTVIRFSPSPYPSTLVHLFLIPHSVSTFPLSICFSVVLFPLSHVAAVDVAIFAWFTDRCTPFAHAFPSYFPLPSLP